MTTSVAVIVDIKKKKKTEVKTPCSPFARQPRGASTSAPGYNILTPKAQTHRGGRLAPISGGPRAASVLLPDHLEAAHNTYGDGFACTRNMATVSLDQYAGRGGL